MQTAAIGINIGTGFITQHAGNHEAGCVPGRATREFVLLDEHDVGPSEFRQVVEDAAARGTAADGVSHPARGACIRWINRVQTRSLAGVVIRR